MWDICIPLGAKKLKKLVFKDVCLFFFIVFTINKKINKNDKDINIFYDKHKNK